jgi:Arc/MetJ family transcription regulator
MPLHRTSIELDDAKVARVAVVLGTRGYKPTIDAALDEVLRQERKRKLIDRFLSDTGIDDAALADVLAQRKPT